LHRKTFAPVAACDPDATLEVRIESGNLFLDVLDDDLNTSQLVDDSPLESRTTHLEDTAA